MKTTSFLRLGAAWVVALLAVGTVSTRADAQATACTAAMDNDVHYCNDDTDLDPSFGPTCDPLGIRWGDAGGAGDLVTLTVEARNNSEFQGDATAIPPGPPAAELLAGTEIAVFYACRDATCAPGKELPGWLVFEAVEYQHTDVSFSDDGNGFSGTLTIDADIPFAREDPLSVKLVRLQLRAGERLPAGPVNPDAVLYARSGQPGIGPMDGSANVLSVMDSECPISSLLGGGQGTTAGRLTPAPLDAGLEVCAHANKQTIKLRNSGPLEFAQSRVSFHFPGYDPSTCDLTFGYDNLVGGSFVFPTLQPGQLEKAGKCYIYQDKNADETGGIQRAQVCPLNSDPNRWCLTIKAHGDLDAILQDAEMPITIQTCGNSYAGPLSPPHEPPLWNASGSTWTLPKAVWDD